MKLRSLLPQDTRIAEIYGAVGLLWLGVHCAVGFINVANLTEIQPLPFWSVLLFLLGSLQISAVVLYPSAEILRVIMSWINGALWLWLALGANSMFTPSDVAAFVLGLGNLYAFIINVSLLRRTWN